MRNFKYILSASLFVLVLFNACKIGHKYKQPEMTDMPTSFDVEKSSEISVADIGWSTIYSDTILQNLIDKALEHNKDVLIATARIKEMEANKRISFANFFPEIGGELGAQREYLNYGGDSKKISPKVKANFNVTWEADIWGNLRWANDASVAQMMQTLEARRALRLTVISQVAQAYFDLQALDRELVIVNQTLIARMEGVRIAKLRYEGGLTSEIPYRQSLVELARTKTLVPSLENDIKLKENDLFVLVGEYPTGYIKRTELFTQDSSPFSLPVDLPSELLKRRPDMLQAEQKLVEANAKVGIAYTDMFPSLKLTGRIGAENSELSQFLKSPTWFISSFLTGPIFNMGKNKAKHKASKAAYEQELYTYEKKVLTVFKEVNNAIITFDKVKEVRMARATLYESAESYHKLAKLQYINGVVSYMEVLDAQRQLFDAEIALNKAKLNELTSVVTLYKALGGGLER